MPQVELSGLCFDFMSELHGRACTDKKETSMLIQDGTGRDDFIGSLGCEFVKKTGWEERVFVENVRRKGVITQLCYAADCVLLGKTTEIGSM